jgi:hypothetical protein
MTVLSTKDERFAALAAALAVAANAGDVARSDACRVIRHELRQRNKTKAVLAPYRSAAAQQVIERYAALGERPPTNGSHEALHCDHVFPFPESELARLLTQETWIDALPHYDLVVCVTEAENMVLEQVERKHGLTGWPKYEAADVKILDEIPPTPPLPSVRRRKPNGRISVTP